MTKPTRSLPAATGLYPITRTRPTIGPASATRPRSGHADPRPGKVKSPYKGTEACKRRPGRLAAQGAASAAPPHQGLHAITTVPAPALRPHAISWGGHSGIVRRRTAVTGGVLIVLAPWLAFGAGLAALCFRLYSRRGRPPAPRPPPGPRRSGPAAAPGQDQAIGHRSSGRSAPASPGGQDRPGGDDGPRRRPSPGQAS